MTLDLYATCIELANFILLLLEFKFDSSLPLRHFVLFPLMLCKENVLLDIIKIIVYLL